MSINDLVPKSVYRSTVKDEKSVYVSLSRLIFVVDDVSSSEELAQGFAKYELPDSYPKAHVILKRGEVPTNIIEDDELIVPFIHIAANPVWNNAAINKRRTIIDDCLERAENTIHYQEDVEALKVINASCSDHSIDFTYDQNPMGFLESINDAMALIERYDNEVAYIIMSPTLFKILRLIDFKHLFIFKNYDKFKNIKGTKIRGLFHDVPIAVNTACPKNAVYVTASPEKVGTIVIPEDAKRGDIVENIKKCRKECVVHERVGIASFNDFAVARVLVTFAVETSKEVELKVKTELQASHEAITSELESIRKTLDKMVDIVEKQNESTEGIPKKRTVFGMLKK